MPNTYEDYGHYGLPDINLVERWSRASSTVRTYTTSARTTALERPLSTYADNVTIVTEEEIIITLKPRDEMYEYTWEFLPPDAEGRVRIKAKGRKPNKFKSNRLYRYKK